MIVAKYCDEPPVDYSDDDDDDGGEEEDLLQNGTNKFHRYEYQDDCISFQSATTTTTTSSLSSIPPILSPPKSKHLYQIPTINFNRLKFEKLIGRGGFGQVYRGQYQQELVAIKEPIYHQQKSIEMINDSLKEEARLQFYLDHPNIIKIYGLSMNHRKIYLVMEYASGKSLQELLQKHNLSPTIIINFAKQISSAMEYLHNFKPKPIIHRDLKSSNILLDQPIGEGRWLEKQLKLTDLGLARELTDSTSMMTPCGTYAWMAPESITHSKFSKASDVWSFGVVLWELLTAEIPYENIAGAAVAYGIGNRQLTLPIPKNCPEELKHILQECWQQEPSLRPSFQKIRNDLEKSSFNVIDMEQFKLMKQNWFKEIWKSLKEKEKELQSREKKAELKEAKMNEIERSLQEKSKRLTEREIEVVGRELKQILEQNEQKNFQRNKSINRKKDGRPPLISYPKDFCHNVTVMKTSLEHSSQPSLQAKTLNKTWTPGTKIRRELHTDLFVNVSRTSSMSQDTDCADVECYHQQQQQQSSSVSSSKMKKIGRFLKRIFGHNDDDHSLLNDNNHRPHEQRSIFHIDSEDNIVDNDTNALVMLSLNRTYHGQTKYSQRIPFWESFQPPPTTTTTNTKTTSTTMNQTASYEWQHNDNDDEFDDEEEDVDDNYNYYSYDGDDHLTNNHSQPYQQQTFDDDDDYNKKIIITNETLVIDGKTMTTTITPSMFMMIKNDDEKIDNDLQQELDQFEMEFQSMR